MSVDRHAPDGGVDARGLHAFFGAAQPARLGVAVSGGGDSVALLHLCASFAVTAHTTIYAVTVDHGLRPAAAAEAAGVAALCADLGIAHETLHWDGAQCSGNLMAAARDARYALIAGWAQRMQLEMVALGHTRDDVAETFLMRLARAAGPDGLATMRAYFTRDGMNWVRPLLDVSRDALRDYLRRHNIAWIEDPTNDDTGFARVRARQVRAALAPLGITDAVLAQVAAAMATTRAALDHATLQAATAHVVQDRADLLLDWTATASLPADIRRRLLLRVLHWIGQAGYAPRAAAVAGLAAALDTGTAHSVAGCLATPDGARIRFCREVQALHDVTAPSDGLWDGKWQLAGPHAPDLSVRALGEAILQCPDWRDAGLPRRSVMASPAIWRGAVLVAAPVAGLANGWSARIVADFASSAIGIED